MLLTPLLSSVKILRVTYGDIQIAKDRARTNGAIRADTLRVIDSDGQQIGILSRQDALEKARLAGLDLVEISPQADPPVAKIIDWGKYQYQKTKQAQKNRKKAKSLEVKQIRFGLKIGEHDQDVKVRKIRTFLEAGHKVKITAFFRGREMAHKELGYKLLDRIYDQIQDIAIIDQEAQLSGKHLSIVVRVTNNAKAQNAQRNSKEN